MSERSTPQAKNLDPSAMPEEWLTFEEQHEAMRERRDFRSPVLWGMNLTERLYVYGASPRMTPEGGYRVIALIATDGTQFLPALTVDIKALCEAMGIEAEG